MSATKPDKRRVRRFASNPTYIYIRNILEIASCIRSDRSFNTAHHDADSNDRKVWRISDSRYYRNSLFTSATSASVNTPAAAFSVISLKR